MTITLYTLTIPPLIRGLNSLSHILQKGADYANEKGIPEDKLLNTRLYEDMAALPFQIQRVSDGAKGAVHRITDHLPVSMPDKESTLAELQTRISKTLDILKNVKESDVNGKEHKEIVIKTGAAEMKWDAVGYVQEFVLPNFYFHVTTAYDILRHQGVPVGKKDFLLGDKAPK